MTQRPTTLRIASPCHESWAAMTPTSTGRHCAACQKTVVDFSQKTDAEILAFFEQAGTGKTCGRFRAEQVARPSGLAWASPGPARWQGWLASLLVAALATQSCQPVLVGEVQPKVAALAPAATAADSIAVVADSATVEIIQARTISGQVYDVATHQPVGQVSVRLKDTDLTTTTDATGHFLIQLPEELATPFSIVLRLTASGYPPTQLLAADTEQLSTKGLAIAQLSYPIPEMILGDVEVLQPKNK
jgi:hypothetical protein